MQRSRKKRGTERERLIWQGIVDYANGDFTSPESSLEPLKILLSRCMGELELGSGWREVIEVQRGATRDRKKQMEESLRYWAAHHHSDLKKVLLWLSAPRENGSLGEAAVQLLQKHTEGISWALGPTYAEFDETGANGVPAFYYRHLSSCWSIMSAICAFLCNRIDQFQDGDLDLLEAIPVRICDRPGCGRFKLPERQRDACYCSNKCRSADHQSQKSPQEKAEYMASYRKRPLTVKAKKRGVK